MSDQNTVTIIVGAKRYDGWKRVRITAGIERLARDFDIDITLRWPGEEAYGGLCKPFDACVAYIGSDKILTGYIDATPVRYDSAGIVLGLMGRSKTADLADCSAVNTPGQWLGQSVEKIAKAIASPYGVSVVSEVDTGDAIADHQVQQGETAFESIDRLLRQRQLLATDNAKGELVFIKPGTKRATTSLMLSKNILSATYQGDHKDRYSTLTVKGQGSGSDQAYGADVTQAKGSAADSDVPRYRNLLLVQNGQATDSICLDRALFECDQRAGKANVVTYVVQGWRQNDGALWEPNALVRVTDDLLGIDEDRLIAEVTYEMGEYGTTTTLLTAPPKAFARISDA